MAAAGKDAGVRGGILFIAVNSSMEMDDRKDIFSGIFFNATYVSDTEVSLTPGQS